MTDSPAANRPHPMLQAALATLDMTVESEMSLFRQYQTLATLPDVPETEMADPQLLSHVSLDSLDAETELAEESLDMVDSVEADHVSAPLNLDATDDISGDLTPSELALFQVDTASAEGKDNFTDDLEQQEAVLEPPPSVDATSTVAGAPLPLDVEGGDSSTLYPAIEDYLDSSTALRQHLEESSSEPDTSLDNTTVITPKKLLLLLGFSILGALAIVLFLHATGLRQKLWPPKRPQPEPTQSSAVPKDPNSSNTVPASPSETPSTVVATKGPDLSKKEFSDVNLGNLSRLQPSPSPAPSAASSSTTPTPTPSPQTPSSKKPVSQEPVPILKDQKSQTGLFYVVLPYNNAASLEQAQKRVPTAFITNGTGGQQVQMGALETMEAAQRLAKRLRAQGLSAAILSP